MKNENVETQVKKFNEYEASIEAVKPYSKLVIIDIEDKEGAITVSSARKECKRLLAKIESDRKDIKAPFLEACKTIDSKASEYKTSVQEVKLHLENEEAKIEAQKQKILQEKQAKIEAEVQRRIDLILTCDVLFTGFSYQLGSVQIMQTEIESLNNDEFSSRFSDLQAIDTELKEAAKLKAEQDKIESDRLERQRKELEAKQGELDRKELESEKREAALKASEEAAKKAEVLRLKNEQEKLDAIKQAKEEEVKRIKDEQEAAKKAEVEKRESVEKAARLAPDKDKLNALSDAVQSLSIPEMSTDEGKEAVKKVKEQMTKMSNWLYSVALNL